MISDVLSDAASDIRDYLDHPVTGECYGSAIRGDIQHVLDQMDRVRRLLDTPPASQPTDEAAEVQSDVKGRIA